MDLDAVKVLLQAQERAYKSAVDVVVEHLNGRLQATEGTITSLTKSLEFSQAELLDLKNEVRKLQKSDADKQAEINCLKSILSDLQHRVNYQDKK